jgi:hypothetical protein
MRQERKPVTEEGTTHTERQTASVEILTVPLTNNVLLVLAPVDLQA